MMHNALYLIKGEMHRLIKYKILQISFIVTLLWLILLFVIGKQNAAMFVPIFIFTDAALMTVLLVGASLFYEKQENTLKTLLITPSSFPAIILSKVVSGTYLAMQSTVLVSLAGYFWLGISVNLLMLYLFVILIVVTHTAIGFSFVIFSKDFTGLIAFVGLYMILFAVPSLLYALGVIPSQWETILMISPTHSSLLLIYKAFEAPVDLWKVLLANGYLLLITIILFAKVVAPNYYETAVKE